MDSFAGMDVILAGDFHQLLPPGGVTPIHDDAKDDASEIFGQVLWKQVNAVVELTQQMRCVDDNLQTVLQALRTGTDSLTFSSKCAHIFLVIMSRINDAPVSVFSHIKLEPCLMLFFYHYVCLLIMR